MISTVLSIMKKKVVIYILIASVFLTAFYFLIRSLRRKDEDEQVEEEFQEEAQEKELDVSIVRSHARGLYEAFGHNYWINVEGWFVTPEPILKIVGNYTPDQFVTLSKIYGQLYPPQDLTSELIENLSKSDFQQIEYIVFNTV